MFRDSPVLLAISRSDYLSRVYIRLTFPNISMVITFIAPAKKVGKVSKTHGSILGRHQHIERMEQHKDIFARFMNKRDFQGLVSDWISRQVYGRLRGTTENDSSKPAGFTIILSL